MSAAPFTPDDAIVRSALSGVAARRVSAGAAGLAAGSAYETGSLRLLSGPRRSSLRRVHRALAVLVMLCLASFQLEALIADVCDGDATPAEVAALVGPASDLPRDAAQVATARAAGTAARALAAAIVSHGDAELPGTPLAPVGHPAHTCHCVHAHGGVLPHLDPVVVHVIDVATTRPIGHPLGASDVARVPLPRPPLA